MLDQAHVAPADRTRSDRFSRFVALAAPALTLAALTACSGGSSSTTAAPENATATVLYWNQTAVDCAGLDHQPTDADHVFGEQVGPCRSARAMAIVHVAVFEAVNAVEGGYDSYVGLPPVAEPTSKRAAVAQASHDTLLALYPSQSARLDQKLTDELAAVPAGDAKTRGITLGAAAADAILDLRANDGSNHPEPTVGVDFFPSNAPGKWRPDPVTGSTRALGARWSEVAPFAMNSADQFRIVPPPALDSAEYALAFNEVLVLGGDGDTTPTLRSEDETFAGIFWAYDGTPSLCAPPRLYNQIAAQIAAQEGTTGIELARLLALVNLSMADAGIAAWESKYYYQFWRPITGIRESDVGTGPSGLGDGNAATVGDASFLPLGAPASNLTGPNFTPPFPAYPSGHATFGGALFQTLRRFYGTDDVAFTFVSDEYNGVTLDNQGQPRPYVPRTFPNFSQAEEENGQSRIYLGIHWNFDKVEGIEQGNEVANWVFDRVFTPAN
ncbi:MAG: phosphatase PAP2 family protein [Planctomycetota bacterium]|nr:phosphatase PAP2 family protein [Planctomycetota bacterium]